jgi:hypothetical protein
MCAMFIHLPQLRVTTIPSPGSSPFTPLSPQTHTYLPCTCTCSHAQIFLRSPAPVRSSYLSSSAMGGSYLSMGAVTVLANRPPLDQEGNNLSTQWQHPIRPGACTLTIRQHLHRHHIPPKVPCPLSPQQPEVRLVAVTAANGTCPVIAR